MDQPILDKATEEERSTTGIEVVVHLSSNTQRAILLGQATSEQIQGIHNLIRAAFETLTPSKALTFVEAEGRTWHFNTNHVVCVEVRTR